MEEISNFKQNLNFLYRYHEQDYSKINMARNSNHLDMHSIRNFEVKVHRCFSLVPLSVLPSLRKILTMLLTISKITKRYFPFQLLHLSKGKTLDKHYVSMILTFVEKNLISEKIKSHDSCPSVYKLPVKFVQFHTRFYKVLMTRF